MNSILYKEKYKKINKEGVHVRWKTGELLRNLEVGEGMCGTAKYIEIYLGQEHMCLEKSVFLLRKLFKKTRLEECLWLAMVENQMN